MDKDKKFSQAETLNKYMKKDRRGWKRAAVSPTKQFYIHGWPSPSILLLSKNKYNRHTETEIVAPQEHLFEQIL